MAYRRREGVLSDVLSAGEITQLIAMHKQGISNKGIADHFRYPPQHSVQYLE
jgi:hypothetical protein